jgi:5-formyltetrahydrofolate cyclo-ligase
MGIPEVKTTVREHLVMARSARPASDGQASGQDLRARLLCLPEVTSSTAIAAYASTADEPNTWPFIQEWTGDLWLPVIVGPSLRWGRYNGMKTLQPNQWGLLEPQAEADDLPDDVTAVVIPALAVDHMGHRLGRGAGYYDRSLQSMTASRPRVIVAVVHDEEVLPIVPHEDFDVPVDIIVTPERVIRVAQASRRSKST